MQGINKTKKIKTKQKKKQNSLFIYLKIDE